ncbi:hypothetical protein [Xanthomonas phage JGB6]|nr:hypothetical protein [Xanthomonas phage JGB6]
MTEGPFDAIGVYKALRAKKLDNKMLAAASFGMSFSVSQHQDDQVNRLLELRKRGLKRVYFLWDNEAPALKAALESCKKVLRYGFQPYLAVLKDAKDPGEATTEQIMRAINEAHPVTSQLQAMMLERQLTK